MCINIYVLFEKETNKLTIQIEDTYLVLDELDMAHLKQFFKPVGNVNNQIRGK